MQSNPETRRAELATTLLTHHEKYLKSKPTKKPTRPIKVVCISDTHSTYPEIPPGDILIHAGDLTQDGSFEEYQEGLTWLSSQPHKFKFLIAGNHDFLLDDVFMQDPSIYSYHPEICQEETRTRHDLDWGTVEYLQDTWTTVEIPLHNDDDDHQKSAASSPHTSPPRLAPTRKVTIFGSPMTPKIHKPWAFQYTADDGKRHWASKVGNMAKAFKAASRSRNHYPANTDTNEDEDDDTIILVTHGPPKRYLDFRPGYYHTGCEYLLDAVYKLRPRLHVFGHVHIAHGIKENVVLDRVRQAYDDVMLGWGGIRTILLMVFFMIWERIADRVTFWRDERRERRDRVTTFVNASMVGGLYNQYTNEAIVVEI